MQINHKKGEIATFLTIATLSILALSTLAGLVLTRNQTSLPSEASTNRSYCGVSCFKSHPDCRLATTCLSEAEAYANQGGGGSTTRYLCWNTDEQDTEHFCVRPTTGSSNPRDTRKNCGGQCTQAKDCFATDTQTHISLQCNLQKHFCQPVSGGECPLTQQAPTTDPNSPPIGGQTPPGGAPTIAPTTGPAPTEIPPEIRTRYFLRITNEKGKDCHISVDILNKKEVAGSEEIRTLTLQDYASCYPKLTIVNNFPIKMEFPYSFDINNRSRQNLTTSLTVNAYVCPEGQDCIEKTEPGGILLSLTSNQSMSCIWDNVNGPVCTKTGTGNPLPSSPTGTTGSGSGTGGPGNRPTAQPTAVPTAIPTAALNPTAPVTPATSTPVPDVDPRCNNLTNEIKVNCVNCQDKLRRRISFDKSTIVLSANQTQSLQFTDTTGLFNNLVIYSDPRANTRLFESDITTGARTLTISPLVLGTYYFRSDVNPNEMNGTLEAVDCSASPARQQGIRSQIDTSFKIVNNGDRKITGLKISSCGADGSCSTLRYAVTVPPGQEQSIQQKLAENILQGNNYKVTCSLVDEHGTETSCASGRNTKAGSAVDFTVSVDQGGHVNAETRKPLPTYDVNNDGVINTIDFVLFTKSADYNALDMSELIGALGVSAR